MNVSNSNLENLRKEINKHPAAPAVFEVFAGRERARNRVTVKALALRMKSKGYSFTEQEYAEVLEKMAKEGFGSLDRDSKGRIKALKDIKITLQSLGSAVLGQQERLSNIKERNKFKELVTLSEDIQTKPDIVKSQSIKVSYSLTLLYVVKDQELRIPIPVTMTPDAIADLITRLQGKKS